MRHRTPQFNHVFSGDGYSAGYYSYLWSDTLTADAWEAFTEARRALGQGRPRSSSNCSRRATRSIRRTPIAPSAAAIRIGALMRKRGFPAPAKSGAARQ